MSQYYLIENNLPIEDSVVDKLTKYFHDTIKIQDIFPNFGTLRIDVTHPFAILNAALINSQPVPNNLFPSITVATVEDALGAQMLNLEQQVVEIDEEWAQAQLVTLTQKNPLVNPAHAQAVYDWVHAGNKTFGIMTVDRITERLIFSSWVDNRILKNFIYAHMRSFIFQNKEFFINDLALQNITLSGTPSGLYNLDFGRILYGSELALMGDRSITNVIVDTDWDTIEKVDMYIQNIQNMES